MIDLEWQWIGGITAAGILLLVIVAAKIHDWWNGPED